MKFKHFYFLAVLAILLIRKVVKKNKVFSNPVEPFNPRVDKRGNWWFGASRGNRKHKGIDIEVSDFQQPVMMPYNGTYKKMGTVYSDDAKYKYIAFDLDAPYQDIELRILYATKRFDLFKGDFLGKGEIVGKTQNVAVKHNKDPRKSKMLPHIHIEIIKNGKHIDPAPYFGLSRFLS